MRRDQVTRRAVVEDRTETAATQRHMFTVTRLALEAQANARPLPATGIGGVGQA